MNESKKYALTKSYKGLDYIEYNTSILKDNLFFVGDEKETLKVLKDFELLRSLRLKLTNHNIGVIFLTIEERESIKKEIIELEDRLWNLKF